MVVEDSAGGSPPKKRFKVEGGDAREVGGGREGTVCFSLGHTFEFVDGGSKGCNDFLRALLFPGDVESGGEGTNLSTH